MAQEWLTPDMVAAELGVCRKTAIALMTQMPHTNIGGVTRKRIRVARNDLDAWMASRRTGKGGMQGARCGSAKRIPRRGEA